MLLDLKQLLHQCNINLRGVIHVGAHHGQELALYGSLGAKELALFEPLSENFLKLMTTVQALQQGSSSLRIQAYQLALGSSHEAKEMTIASNQGQSSSLLKPKQHLVQHPQIVFEKSEQVYVTRMDRIITQPDRYNFISIDVQGFELEVLKGAGESVLRHIEGICCEVNRDEVYEGNAMVEDIDAFLSRFGFARIATNWAGGTWGDAFYCRSSLLQRDSQAEVATAPPIQMEDFCRTYQLNFQAVSGSQLIPKVNMPDPCRLVAGAGSNESIDRSRVSALRVVRMGRFSNNLIQLLHAVLVARQLDIQTIIFPSDFAHFTGVNSLVNGVTFLQEELAQDSAAMQLLSYFWFPAGSLAPLFKRVLLRQATAEAEFTIKPLFYQHSPLVLTAGLEGEKHAHRVVVHIRSGDLFVGSEQSAQGRRPHPYYVQPPLAFYRVALEHALNTLATGVSVQLVIQDRNNPVVTEFEQWLNSRSISYQVIDGLFMEAVQTMLAAHVMISSYGSVVEMISMLSDCLHTIYAFKGFGRWAEREFGGHGNYEYLGGAKTIYEMQEQSPYIQPGSWQDSPDQRRLMIHYPASVSSLAQRFVEGSSMHDEALFFSA
jgi:FkbM family methyltransferase